MCWNRVTVTELKFTMSEWRTDRLLWKQRQGYVGWLRRLKPVGSAFLSGSATPLRPAAPWHDIIWWKLSPLMKWRRSKSPINNRSKKWSIQTHVRSQTNTDTHTHTHVYEDKHNTDRRTDTVCQSKLSISTAQSQHWHNPKSTWLKLDLSNSAQTVSVTSKSFSPDWRGSVTLDCYSFT